MAGPVSLETETPSAPFLKGRGLGVSEKLPLRIRKPEALAKGEHRDVPTTDLVMALGPARNVPPARGSRGLGCQLVVPGGFRERVGGREGQPVYLPAQRPRSPTGRKETANTRHRPVASLRRAPHRPFPRPTVSPAWPRGRCVGHGCKRFHNVLPLGHGTSKWTLLGSFIKPKLLILIANFLRGFGGILGDVLSESRR